MILSQAWGGSDVEEGVVFHPMAGKVRFEDYAQYLGWEGGNRSTIAVLPAT